MGPGFNILTSSKNKMMPCPRARKPRIHLHGILCQDTKVIGPATYYFFGFHSLVSYPVERHTYSYC